ncbi:MAG: hypothetical protein C5B56_00195 [Proteobacteria bacterium]|nr:MAG: hypothetical protein C5B56_00195 [Pseudomonadota bacterium]
MAKASSARRESLYGVHPGVAMMQKWVAELKDKTGRSLDEWVALIRKEGPKTEKERRQWLKVKHKLASNTTWWLAERAEGKGGEEDSPEAYLQAAVRYVAEQYSGAKAALRPIYDELLDLGRSLGADVKACPCRTIVPLYRTHVFAQIKPTTNTRIDLGLALTHYKGRLPKRLIDTGGLRKKDRITHRLPISSKAEIDAEVHKWLRTAYELAES